MTDRVVLVRASHRPLSYDPVSLQYARLRRHHATSSGNTKSRPDLFDSGVTSNFTVNFIACIPALRRAAGSAHADRECLNSTGLRFDVTNATSNALEEPIAITGDGPNRTPRLAIEILEAIFLRLHTTDILSLAVACRRFYELVWQSPSLAMQRRLFFRSPRSEGQGQGRLYNRLVINDGTQAVELRYSPYVFVHRLQYFRWSNLLLFDPLVDEVVVLLFAPMLDVNHRVVVTSEKGVQVADIARGFDRAGLSQQHILGNASLTINVNGRPRRTRRWGFTDSRQHFTQHMLGSWLRQECIALRSGLHDTELENQKLWNQGDSNERNGGFVFEPCRGIETPRPLWTGIAR
ncbi:hypothetical protein LTR17_021839 [Elasticomyces elasticus]|nr:hypothetical protein LTR17_021839 [Elasticomyces elasticus]